MTEWQHLFAQFSWWENMIAKECMWIFHLFYLLAHFFFNSTWWNVVIFSHPLPETLLEISSALLVGGWILQISFSTYPVLLAHTIFPSSACVCIHITHLQVHMGWHTQTKTHHVPVTQRQLIWSVCVLRFKGDFTLMFGLDERTGLLFSTVSSARALFS